MKRKPTKIKVVCTKPIALEMCRYEGSHIVSEVLLDNSWDKVVDGWIAKGTFKPEERQHEYDQHRKYEFVIEGDYHVMGRWASFGVRPQILE